ncbi:TRAP transporter large permease [Rhodospirillaceae bacterium KN72]|uniref:TRAP transporter large permease protein n=1 Tax=Pacificispira spongiicola TaxID=2729598 RepID=A0A7Y0HEG9_9PROT|nr:TRAP transporter large permease [Pacificispira spongiicola]NMM43553.1 TRAP transporter large permease [Pacificispira spongiicola]
MTPPIIGVIGILALLLLIGLRVPVAIAMGAVGIVGGIVLNGWFSVGFVLGSQPFTTTSSYALSVIPLFVMMGAFASRAGLSSTLYRSLQSLIGHWRGGLASATIGACAIFGSVCGSSLATAATMARVAIPEMTQIGYDRRLTSGALAAGGTLGILIPPSIIMVIYALLTEQSIGRMFLAGLIPGILAAALYIATTSLIVRLRPDSAPSMPKATFRQQIVAVRQMWPVAVLFGMVMGGIYLGFFSPTEAAGVGAFGAIGLAAFKRVLTWTITREALIETASTTGMLFMILVGTSILQFFIETSGLPRVLVDWIGEMGLPPIGVIVMILIAYVILGCFLDSLSMMLITLPIVFPLVTSLGYDPIWFGVLVVSVVEIGLITPPLGMNLFVIAASTPDLKFETVARGVVPFLLADLVRIALLVAIPALSLTLPDLLM